MLERTLPWCPWCPPHQKSRCQKHLRRSPLPWEELTEGSTTDGGREQRERSSEEEVRESDKEEEHRCSSVLCCFKQSDTVFTFTAMINTFREYTATVCTRTDPVCCITIQNKIYKRVTICETLMVDKYDNFTNKYPRELEFCCVEACQKCWTCWFFGAFMWNYDAFLHPED